MNGQKKSLFEVSRKSADTDKLVTSMTGLSRIMQADCSLVGKVVEGWPGGNIDIVGQSFADASEWQSLLHGSVQPFVFG